MSKIIYLCGPIMGCTDIECKGWREEVKRRYPNTLDPMRRDYREFSAPPIKEIVENDKKDVMECDILLVMYDKPSVGTSMEVLFGWELHKTIIIINPLNQRVPLWLEYHSNHIVSTLEEAYNIIDSL